MNSNLALALAFACAPLMALTCAPCMAQTQPAVTSKTAPLPAPLPAPSSAATAKAPAPPKASAPRIVEREATERGEPEVRHIVIEDDGSKIEELRVRGQTQHVVVTPKVGTTRSYEIIVSHSGREPPDSTGGAQSAVGKRVWNVLKF
jgi:hypothetical protein